MSILKQMEELEKIIIDFKEKSEKFQFKIQETIQKENEILDNENRTEFINDKITSIGLFNRKKTLLDGFQALKNDRSKFVFNFVRYYYYYFIHTKQGNNIKSLISEWSKFGKVFFFDKTIKLVNDQIYADERLEKLFIIEVEKGSDFTSKFPDYKKLSPTIFLKSYSSSLSRDNYFFKDIGDYPPEFLTFGDFTGNPVFKYSIHSYDNSKFIEKSTDEVVESATGEIVKFLKKTICEKMHQDFKKGYVYLNYLVILNINNNIEYKILCEQRN